MRHALLVGQLLSTPWALMPEHLATLCGVVARWALDRAPSAETIASVQASANARATRKATAVQSGGGAVAVMTAYGIVTHRENMDVSGPGTMSCNTFISALREIEADDAIGGAVIDFDTPGGSVYGVIEAADELFRVRQKKPVYAIANTMAASAGYWLATQANELYVAPSGVVGSIGVYMAHEDWSKALADLGVTTTFIQAGEFKTEGAPHFPLTAAAKAHLQASVDSYYNDFTAAIARGRGVPVEQARDGMGKGRVYRGAEALAAGMVNGVATLDQVVAKMQSDLRAGAVKPGARIELERRRLALAAG